MHFVSRANKDPSTPATPCGLVNQGATCYLNSLLQTLYMAPEFRRGVYEWQYDPSLHGEKESCIPYQVLTG